jgi:hypothetical protein
MNTLTRILIPASMALALVLLGGCKKEEAAPAQAEAAAVVVPMPTDNNTDAWRAYFRQELRPHMDKRYRRPFTYFVPMGEDEESLRQYNAQLENAQNAIGRGVQAGSMLAFGGPQSSRTADLVLESFKLAGPKSMKGVRIVVFGNAADRERVTAAIAPSEADFIYIETP